jgi:putative ABC transport system permease protein
MAIQFDTAGEAVRLEREARRARGERSEISSSQPALLERVHKPAAELPPIAPPRISAVVATVAPGHDAEQVASTIAAWGDVTVHSRDDQRNLLLEGSIEKVRR